MSRTTFQNQNTQAAAYVYICNAKCNALLQRLQIKIYIVTEVRNGTKSWALIYCSHTMNDTSKGIYLNAYVGTKVYRIKNTTLD